MALTLFGFMLGIRHALEADHLAAVAALAGQQRELGTIVRQALAWSLGHASVLLLVGSILLAAQTPLSSGLASVLEALVGIVLIVLGARILLRLLHAAPALATTTADTADAAAGLQLNGSPTTATAVGVGVLHGLAGSAALLLLSLNESPTLGTGLGMIATFSIGSILGMVAVSLVVAYPLRELQRHSTAFGLL
ncbi:MAG: hypothetical protein AAGG11_19845, partial [Pseudomonadota bacterium]